MHVSRRLSQHSSQRDWELYWQLFQRYLWPQKWRVLLLAVLVLTSLGLLLVNPQLIRYFIDSIEEQRSLDQLMGAAAIFTVLTIIQQLIVLAATYVGEVVGWTATNHLRADLALHCLKLDLAFHKTHTPGELIERVDGDVNQLAKLFSQLVIRLTGNVLLFIGVLLLLWVEGWQIGLSITLVALVGLIVLEILRKWMVPRWERTRAAEAALYGFIEERINGTEDIRANGAVPYVMQRLYLLLRARVQAFAYAMRLNAFVISFPLWIFGPAYAAALLLGGQGYLDGVLTVGGVYLIFHYVGVMEGPLWESIRQVEEMQKALASINRIVNLFAIQPRMQDGRGVQLPSRALAVEFDQVDFHYEDDTETVLTNLSFSLQPGRVLGLLGRTGSGKSTLSKLLFRFYHPTAGAIWLGDGNGIRVNMRDARDSDLRGRIGMVTQEVQLFHASVRDNLTLFDDGIDDARVLEVIREVGLASWFDALPDGLETVLGTDSALSAGEAQLLAFARVFLNDPGLVILDEASSRLDPATEQQVEQALDKLLHGRTGIIIAHRLATVQRADEIMVLEQGTVGEYGERVRLAADPQSRFSQLLQTGLEEAFTGTTL